MRSQESQKRIGTRSYPEILKKKSSISGGGGGGEKGEWGKRKGGTITFLNEQKKILAQQGKADVQSAGATGIYGGPEQTVACGTEASYCSKTKTQQKEPELFEKGLLQPTQGHPKQGHRIKSAAKGHTNLWRGFKKKGKKEIGAEKCQSKPE